MIRSYWFVRKPKWVNVIAKDRNGIFVLAEIQNDGTFTWNSQSMKSKESGLTKEIILESFETWNKLDALGVDTQKTFDTDWGILNKSGE